MEWTYLTYTIADYGISIGLVLAAIIGVIATFFSSKKGQEFVTERVIGISPTKAHDDYSDFDIIRPNINMNSLNTNGNYSDSTQRSVHINQRSLFYIGIICCLLGGLTLSITAVLIFQGSFLVTVRLLPNDDCPEYPVDCFVFGTSGIAPISNNVSFVCERLERATFPNNNITDATAWCYGWIIRLQSTKSVLDQLGVAIALIGFFTTLLAAIVYLGKCKKTVVLSIIFISTCGSAIIILLVFKWTFAPLTYAILSLGIGLGIFGLVLFCILPKPVKETSNQQMRTADIDQTTVINNSALSYAKRPSPTAPAPHYAKISNQSSKIVPQ